MWHAARLAATVLLARVPAVGKAGLPRPLSLPKEGAENAGKRSLLRRLLSSRSSVNGLLGRTSTLSSAGSISAASSVQPDGTELLSRQRYAL